MYSDATVIDDRLFVPMIDLTCDAPAFLIDAGVRPWSRMRADAFRTVDGDCIPSNATTVPCGGCGRPIGPFGLDLPGKRSHGHVGQWRTER